MRTRVARVKKIKEIKARRDWYIKRDNDFNSKPIYRAERYIELLKTGVDVEETEEGFLVDKRFIVAAQKNRWRAMGRWKWYWFKSVEDFVKKYV